jgi:hypothetical protein
MPLVETEAPLRGSLQAGGEMISSGLRAHISSSCGFHLSWMGWKDDEYLPRLFYILNMSHPTLCLDADDAGLSDLNSRLDPRRIWSRNIGAS